MIVLLYATRHGSTAKIARVIDTYLDQTCVLMNLEEMHRPVLEKATTIVLGMPVYYGELEPAMVSFVKDNWDFLKTKNPSLYVVGLQYTEFMRFVTDVFDYDILKDMNVIAGLGGALYYPKLSLQERMILRVMNKRIPVIPKEHNELMYENFNNEEIAVFAKKIRRIEKEQAGE